MSMALALTSGISIMSAADTRAPSNALNDFIRQARLEVDALNCARRDIVHRTFHMLMYVDVRLICAQQRCS